MTASAQEAISLKATGVYIIANLENGKVYVGSSAQSFAERFRIHRRELRAHRHHSRHLQSSWNKHGEDAFMFVPIQSTSPEDAVRVEQLFIDGWTPDFNVALTARSPLGIKRTDETKARLKAALKLASARPEVRARRSAAQKVAQNRPERLKINAAIKETWSNPDARALARAKALARNLCPEYRARVKAAKNSACANPEYRARMSAAAKEHSNRPERIEQQRAAFTQIWSDPEMRARMLAANLARSPVTQLMADEIRRALDAGETGEAIASRFKISGATVSRIKHNQRWVKS